MSFPRNQDEPKFGYVLTDFDDNVGIKEEWLEHSPDHKKISKTELDMKNKDSVQTKFEEKPSYSQGPLRDRIAARSGFNAPRLNTDNILGPPCLTISSPGLSPASLLESPVFLSNPLSSPTTGKLSSLPSYKAKDDFFDDISTSLALQSISRSSFDPINIGLEPNDSQDYEQRQLGGSGDSMASGAPADDGYNWRKYGQKLVKGSEYPRSYYKCTYPNCEVKKKVERSREGHITEIIYNGAHNHPKHPPNRRSGIGSSGTCLEMQIDGIEQTEQEGFTGTNENVEWRSPVSAKLEYGCHSGSIQDQSGTMFGYADTFYRDEVEEDRLSHMSVSMGYGQVDESEPKRRKLEAYAAEMSGSNQAVREPKVVVETLSDIDILDDGYRWRKYGQKVVKGNPNPRSYYKCTANGCTVTKHVERASDNLMTVLTTYIGIHTHSVPAARNGSHQGGLATQTHNHHVHYPVAHSRSEGLGTANSSLFDFQPHLRPPGSSYIGETELSDFSMPGLANGKEKLPSLPAPAFGDPAGLMLQLAAEPKVELPMSQPGLELSQSSSIYSEIISRLPHM